MRIAVIGVGLIGGSIALAARQRLGAETAGWDPDPSALSAALQRGALDQASRDISGALDGAEAAFVAAPIGALPELVSHVLDLAPERCVVTDVGSTKRLLKGLHDDQRFVGGHPIAGAETAGIAHARPDLFEGATWYLTPTTTTSGLLYERLHRIIGGLGARPVAIDPDAHDRMLALVSHLPHVLANVLVAQVAQTATGDGDRLPATGPSFRDATRVAGSNSAIWTDIYLSNADAIAAAVEETIERLATVRDNLRAADPSALRNWNESAGADRRRLLEAQLASGPLHELRVSIPNRPGVVAELALELGRAGVNIADLALYPAPDMSEGVVALWIAGENTVIRAEQLIADRGFPVARP